MEILIVIPARGGSKGVPGKNIKPLAGKPLIYYTIDAARAITKNDNICVSTDSNDIANVVEAYGLKVPFMRPGTLATDNASANDVMLHALNFYEQQGKAFDVMIYLQPTSPFRNGTHIEAALKLYADELDMIVSVYQTKSNPYYTLFEEDENGFLKQSKNGNFVTRQECPPVYEYNGAIYIININRIKSIGIDNFKKIGKYEMDEMRSIDIDTPTDWLIAEALFNSEVIK